MSFFEQVWFFSGCYAIAVILEDQIYRSVFRSFIEHSDMRDLITHIRVFYERSENGTINLIFQDDGNGIAATEKPNLFKEGHGRGTGYGLYLIKKMMEVYGWTIRETGEPGKGARFVMAIPRINQKGTNNYRVN